MTNGSNSQRTASEVRAEVARQRRRQSELAAALGISQGGVSRRLYGHVPFSVEELVVVARLLGKQPADFLPDIEPVAAGA